MTLRSVPDLRNPTYSAFSRNNLVLFLELHVFSTIGLLCLENKWSFGLLLWAADIKLCLAVLTSQYNPEINPLIQHSDKFVNSQLITAMNVFSSIFKTILVWLKECTGEVKSGKWRHIFCCTGSHHDIANNVLLLITITTMFWC